MHEELLSCSAFGTFGEHPGNINRDLQRYPDRMNLSFLPAPSSVQTVLTDPKSGFNEKGELFILEPHQLVHCLHKRTDQFRAFFRTDLVESFWSKVKKDDPKYQLLLKESGMTPGDLKTVVPLFLRGDGVEFQNNHSLLTFPFGQSSIHNLLWIMVSW